jgi:Rrf2 family protein
MLSPQRFMMCLSQTAGYAIHALGYLADHSHGLCLIRDIAKKTQIPKPYLAKIINQLAREGLVSAKRGYRGGIFLARPPAEISLLQVVEAIEGKGWIGECMLGLDDCHAQHVCPTHDIWRRIREEVADALRRSTLSDVINSMRGTAPQATANLDGCLKGVVPLASAKKKAAPRPKLGKRNLAVQVQPCACAKDAVRC